MNAWKWAPMPVHFFHSGDLGDIVYSLPTIRAHGGGVLHIGPEDVGARSVPSRRLVRNIAPLLESQTYIVKVTLAAGV
jgi:hypothetical protein